MNNWVELKSWVEDMVKNSSEVNQHHQLAFNNVLVKMESLEQQDYFQAYTDQDGLELIETKSEEGVAVWTHIQHNNKYIVKVPKAAVLYFDEETKSYDCNTEQVSIVKKL